MWQDRHDDVLRIKGLGERQGTRNEIFGVQMDCSKIKALPSIWKENKYG